MARRTDQPEGDAGRGHLLMPHTADCIIEAWGPDAAACFEEAMSGLVDCFAEVPDAPATSVIPVSADPDGPEDLLVYLLDDLIYTIDVCSVVPVRFHLSETEDGGIAGDMEVVPAGQVTLIGPVPKAVSYHDLSMAEHEGSWRCHVLIDV